MLKKFNKPVVTVLTQWNDLMKSKWLYTTAASAAADTRHVSLVPIPGRDSLTNTTPLPHHVVPTYRPSNNAPSWPLANIGTRVRTPIVLLP